jgi:phosphotransferase system  glucose/maltose/N-acetylglucosamine-specific IIC component
MAVDKERKANMGRLKNPYLIIPIVASVIVGIMLPPAAAESQGVPRAIMFTLLAILVIWICFIGFGFMIGHIMKEEVGRKEEEHKKDFV